MPSKDTLQIVDGKDEAILCEGKCSQWYHRGCASVPPERYKELSSNDDPFFCLSCTCHKFKEEFSELSSTVVSLREELRNALKMEESISALKSEVSLLKQSLHDAMLQLEEFKRPALQPAESKPQPRSYAAAVRPNNGKSKWANVVRGSSNSRRAIPRNDANRQYKTRAATPSTNAPDSNSNGTSTDKSSLRVVVPGVRRVGEL